MKVLENKDDAQCLSITVILEEVQTKKYEGDQTNTLRDSSKTKGCQNDALQDSQKGTNGTELAINSKKQLVAESPPRMVTQVLGSIVVALTHLGIGTIYGFPGVTLPQLTSQDTNDIYLSDTEAALFGSIINVGAICGGIMCGPLLAKIGHRRSLLLILPSTLGFWLMIALATNVLMIIVARFCLGMLLAAINTSSTAYIVEISHKTRRGMLCSLIPTCRQLGFLLTYVTGIFSLSWRHIAYICCAITTSLPFIGLFFFPESPRWLVTRGREEEAAKSLKFFRGEDHDYLPELKEIIEQVKSTNKQNTCNQCTQLFQKSTLKLFMKLSLLTLLVGCNGSFAITTYLVPIFQAASSEVNAYVSAVLVGVVRVIGTVSYLFVVDHFGRRPFHLTGYLMMFFCHTILGGYFFFQNTDWVSANLGWLPLTIVLLYTFFLGLSQPVLFMVHGELLHNNVRSIGLSILTSVLFLGAFVMTQVFPVLINAVGIYGNFLIYGIGCLFMVVVSYFTLPETKGRALEEINKESDSDKAT